MDKITEENITQTSELDVDEDETKSAQTTSDLNDSTDETIDGGDEKVDELTALREQLSIQEAAVTEAKDKALRAVAEMENLRRRTIRDVENAHKFALERFITDLLPVFDSIELALATSDGMDKVDAIYEGLNLTLKMLTGCFEKFGVQILQPEGEKFDPNKHEAVSIEESDNSSSGDVISVMQKGCELNGRLVRPAMVVVAK